LKDFKFILNIFKIILKVFKANLKTFKIILKRSGFYPVIRGIEREMYAMRGLGRTVRYRAASFAAVASPSRGVRRVRRAFPRGKA
jgi:hypothetical protein